MCMRGCVLAVTVFGLGDCEVGTDGTMGHVANIITVPFATK